MRKGRKYKRRLLISKIGNYNYEENSNDSGKEYSEHISVWG